MDSILRINKWDCPEIWSLQYLIFSKAECCGSKIVMIQFHYNVNVNFITMAYSRFHHQNTVTGVFIKRSPKSGPRQNTTSAAKCGMPKDKMQRNATEWCPILSHFALFCHIMSHSVSLCCVSSHYVKFCRCSFRGGTYETWNLVRFCQQVFDGWKFWKFLRSVKICFEIGEIFGQIFEISENFRQIFQIGEHFGQIFQISENFGPIFEIGQILSTNF